MPNQRVKPRVRADDLFPPQSEWWPANMSLDELRASRLAGKQVPIYFTEQRDAEVTAWWAATEPNRARYRDGG